MADKAEGAGMGEGKGSLLLSIRHPTLALADGCCVALPAADRREQLLASSARSQAGRGRAEQEGTRNEKRAEGRWGPLLRWSAGDQRPPFRRARADGQHPA